MNMLVYDPQEILYPNGRLVTSRAYQLPGRQTNWNLIQYRDGVGEVPILSAPLKPVVTLADSEEQSLFLNEPPDWCACRIDYSCW